MANGTEYRLVFGSNINLDVANNLRARICQILERPDFGSLVIMFSSEGGSTDESLALFNFVSQLPVPVRMHAIGHVGSVAVPVFLAGHRRTSSPLARFFFHEYDWGFLQRQTLNRINEAVSRLRSDVEMSRKIIQSHTQVPDEILRSLDGQAPSVLISPEQAKAFGLVEDVLNLGESGDNGMKVAVWSA